MWPEKGPNGWIGPDRGIIGLESGVLSKKPGIGVFCVCEENQCQFIGFVLKGAQMKGSLTNLSLNYLNQPAVAMLYCHGDYDHRGSAPLEEDPYGVQPFVFSSISYMFQPDHMLLSAGPCPTLQFDH